LFFVFVLRPFFLSFEKKKKRKQKKITKIVSKLIFNF
jgi:hypothetical protein